MKGMRDIIEQVAKDNNTTPKEVRRELKIMIDSEWKHNTKWHEVFATKPTPEEVILKFAMHIKNESSTCKEFYYLASE